MSRPARRTEERRKQALAWLDVASKMSKGNTLFIPMNHGVERTQTLAICEEIIGEHESLFPTSSVYSGLKCYSTHKRHIPYLAITKPEHGKITSKAYIVDKNNKEKVLSVLLKSKHTRVGQIKLLVSEGHSIAEIRAALGGIITKEEEKVLKDFENISRKSENLGH